MSYRAPAFAPNPERTRANGSAQLADSSQSTRPAELPISGSTERGEIELRIESETHKYFTIRDKQLRLTRPLDRDAILAEVSSKAAPD